MSILDAGAMADTAIRLGVLSAHHAEGAWAEIGSRKADPGEFLRAMERKGYLTPYQTTKLIRGDSDGYFLGGYRLLYKIASGSFGRVYRADDPSSGRIAAIKVLRKKWLDDRHKIELFLREGKVGMSLRHPNIVEILAVNHEKLSNQYFIVMEFVEGGNLRDFLNIRKKLSASEVLRILEDTASGLAHAGSLGITHRDMKLTNVLLSSNGPSKLVDFGLAGGQLTGGRKVGYDKRDEDEVAVDRTIDYAGLEKVSNAPHGDPRSDLFFLGCIAYELLTGRGPLELSHSVHVRMSARRFETIIPIKPDEVEGPPSVIRLVESMMTLDAEQRIQTASQLVERVRDIRFELKGAVAKPGVPAAKKSQATIFLVENDEKLQDVLRTKLKEEGFRVLIAADPMRAMERFRQQPFDLLIVDATTVGENGYYVFERIMDDVQRQSLPCRGIIMLNADQTDWQENLKPYAGATTLIQPVKYRQLLQAIRASLQENGGGEPG